LQALPQAGLHPAHVPDIDFPGHQSGGYFKPARKQAPENTEQFTPGMVQQVTPRREHRKTVQGVETPDSVCRQGRIHLQAVGMISLQPDPRSKISDHITIQQRLTTVQPIRNALRPEGVFDMVKVLPVRKGVQVIACIARFDHLLRDGLDIVKGIPDIGVDLNVAGVLAQQRPQFPRGIRIEIRDGFRRQNQYFGFTRPQAGFQCVPTLQPKPINITGSNAKPQQGTRSLVASVKRCIDQKRVIALALAILLNHGRQRRVFKYPIPVAIQRGLNGG
jgi:hypothetical protein